MCFQNVYVLQLTTNYGFTSYSNLNIADKVNGYSLNWALGYLINELNRDDFLPYEDTPRKLQLSVYLPITVVLSLVIALLLASLIYSKYIQKKAKNKEESLLN